MATGRKKVGILFSYSEGWIGGTYYFINLVHALNQLADGDKPEVIIVSNTSDALNIIKGTGYPYLRGLPSAFHYNILEKLINKAGRVLLKREQIRKDFKPTEMDVLFGYYEQLFKYSNTRKLFWIPDLQDKYYPQYLDEQTVRHRQISHQKIACTKSEVLFSSNDAKNDFDKFYPGSICEKYVAQFAVTLPGFDDLSFAAVAGKFGITGPYFFSPNQFWSHKNHVVVIKAVELLKQSRKNVTVVFTGNENTGDGSYAAGLKDMVKKAGLQQNCLFLGFIDRKEQLLLMKNAIAVVQPSLFEGWSTVVEDAKAMGKYLILSALNVHREQVDTNAVFFDPANPDALCSILSDCAINKPESSGSDYNKNIRSFAHAFMQAINGKTI